MVLAMLFAMNYQISRAELVFEPSWKVPSYAQVRDRMAEWIEQAQLSTEQTDAAFSNWPQAELRSSEGASLLERAVETFSIADSRVTALIEDFNSQDSIVLPPSVAWLDDPALSKTMRDNLQLYAARWFSQQGYYDEAIEQLADLKPENVIDPAGLLFYQAVAYQQLVEPEKSRIALVQLLEQEDALPERYLQVAKLLEHDLSGLKDESLDHVARRMNDVRRRLDIGRAGKQVQVVEKGVLDSLDKLIEKLEEQQQQQQQSQSLGGGGQGEQPMQDSMLPSMKAPMQVDKRDIGSKSGWGDLPPKEREQALQQIGREFPAHYREIIEQYFRELADESNSSQR